MFGLSDIALCFNDPDLHKIFPIPTLGYLETYFNNVYLKFKGMKNRGEFRIMKLLFLWASKFTLQKKNLEADTKVFLNKQYLHNIKILF